MDVALEMVAQYRVAFIRASDKAGNTADTLALLREHRADRRTDEKSSASACRP